jgi:hypothetical protein
MLKPKIHEMKMASRLTFSERRMISIRSLSADIMR